MLARREHPKISPAPSISRIPFTKLVGGSLRLQPWRPVIGPAVD